MIVSSPTKVTLLSKHKCCHVIDETYAGLNLMSRKGQWLAAPKGLE